MESSYIKFSSFFFAKKKTELSLGARPSCMKSG